MKKRLSFLLALLIPALCLTGCLKKEPEEFPTEEIEALLDDYLEYERYTVYDTPSMKADWDHPVDVKGKSHRYSRVTDPRFDTWEEWTAFAGSIFGGRYLIQRFNEQDHFLNLDGDTYCFGVTAAWSLSQDYEYEILYPEDGGVVLELRRTGFGQGDEGADVVYS